MATENTMTNNCPVEEAARTCPLLGIVQRILMTPAEDQEPTPTEDKVPTPTVDQELTPAEDQEPTPTEEQAPTPAEEQAPTPAEEQAPTPTEENQDPTTGGVEMDRAAEALNWLRMGQIVGIIVMGAESNDDNAEDEPTEDPESTATPTPAHAEETAPAEVTIAEPDSAHRELPSQQQTYPEYHHPMRDTFASREDIERLNDLLGSLTDPNNEPDQTRGRARDICHLALELGADRLVDVCEDFTEGDATRADVAATASEVLTYLAAETRRAELTEAFQEFCKSNGTNPKEMAEYIC